MVFGTDFAALILWRSCRFSFSLSRWERAGVRVPSSRVPRWKPPSPGLRPASPSGRGKIDYSRSVGHMPCRTPLASCPALFGAERHKAKFRDVPLVLIGGFLPPAGSDVVITEAKGSQSVKRAACPVASAPGFLCHRLTSSGVPMPTSVLRKQAQPGGRKRSARAVNGGLDGRRERQASGRGHPRAHGC